MGGIKVLTVAAALLLVQAPVVRAQTTQPSTAAAAPVQLTDAQKLYGLSKIWQEANYNFAFFDQVPELDWDSAYQAFIPQVLKTNSTYEYYRTLQRFIALLRDGHTNVFLPGDLVDRHEVHYPWVLTRGVGQRALVRNVGASLETQIPTGSEILAVDGVPVTRYAREHLFPFIATGTEHTAWNAALGRLLYGPADTPVGITYVTPTGKRREATLLRDHRSREDQWARSAASEAKRFEFRWLQNGIAYVALNTFRTDSVAADFEALLPELSRARGLIIDVRANRGGNSGVAYRIASYLTSDTLATSRWRTPKHIAAFKAWGCCDEKYRGYAEMNAWHESGDDRRIPPAEGKRIMVPTVVLQAHATGSAAEDFLVALDAVPHITTVGQLTYGSTGQPLFFDLPGGGRARVVTKRDTYPDGRDFVGVGVRPEVPVEPTIADVRAGRDRQLERAMEILKQRLRKR